MSSNLPPTPPAAPRPPRQLQMVSAPKNPSDLELEVYKAMASLFNSEESAFWTRNNILAVIHGGLLAATAGIVANSEKALAADAPPFASTLLFGALTVLALVGLGMAIAWRFMVARGEKIADTVSDKLKDIEREFAGRAQLNFSTTFHAFVNFGDKLQTKPAAQMTPDDRFNNVRLSKIWGRVGQSLMWLWAVLALLFSLILLSGYARPHASGPASGPAAGGAAAGAAWGAASNAISNPTPNAASGAAASGAGPDTAALIAAVAQATAAARAATDAAQSAASAAAAATRAAQQVAAATSAATATTPTPNAGGASSPSSSAPGGIAAGGATPPVHAPPHARTHTQIHTHAAPHPCTCATRASGAR